MSDLEHDTTIKIQADGIVTLSIGFDGKEHMYINLTDQAGDSILTIEVEAVEVKQI